MLDADTLELAVEASPTERLGKLFDRHHQRLYRLALRMARDPDVAQDLVQEAFLRAARRADSLPADPGGAEAYLVRIVVNLCRDRWRRSKVRREAGPMPAWGHNEPDRADADLKRRRFVERALAVLRPRTRAVIVMTEIEGLPRAEVARQLGITETTVRWHLSTGRRRIMKEMER